MKTASNLRVLRTIPLLIAFCLVSFPAQAQYSGGTGEPNDPYQIATAEDLMLLGETPEDYDNHFILTADIDLDPNLPGHKVFDRAIIAPDTNDTEDWFQGIPFTGVVDGDYHTISRLTIAGVSYLGLFGQLGYGAMISNLGLEAVDVNGIGDYVGGLVGCSSGIITTSYSTGTVTGDEDVGGLVGSNDGGGGIATSYSAGAIIGNTFVGGLVGSNRAGSIATSYSTGAVAGDRYVGGLVGYNVFFNRSIISTSYSTGTVIGNSIVGGLVGYGYGGIATSFWDIETSGQISSASGTGLTTAKMQDIDTFLSKGWDFVDEVLNGTCDYWQISQDDYPRLRYHAGESPVMPEGLGTAQEPYLIRDAWDLGTVWSKPMAHYRLESSVDLSEITWSMAVVPWFEGVFDGNGHVINKLHIQGSGHLGLFGQLGFGAEISNLGLEAVDVNGTGAYVGGLVGFSSGSVTTSYSSGAVSGTFSVGGLMGYNSGIITTSYSDGTVTGSEHVGGLAGFSGGTDYYPSGQAHITNSYSSGTVTGNEDVGGLVGFNGRNITTSYSSGAVSGASHVGGLAGRNYGGGSIAASYSTGMVKGEDYVGGLVGRNYRSIIMSYSTGIVSGGVRICGGDRVGGLVGSNTGSITTSFWDMEVSGQTWSYGGTGLTTAEMQTASTFLEVGWDFIDETANGPNDIWKISEGLDYPRLWWEKCGGGTGEPNDPYLIYTAEQLNEMGAEPNDYDKHFKLMADIDLSGYVYDRAVIAPDVNDAAPRSRFQGTSFIGIFDGNGHTISHMTIVGGKYLGLFGMTRGDAVISDLCFEAVDVNGTGDWVGSLVGWNKGNASIINCHSSGKVTGKDYVGGLVGENLGGVPPQVSSIVASYSSGTVSGAREVGGLVGRNWAGGIITASYSSGSVNGEDTVGGLVGYGSWGISGCYSTGTVSGDENVGGLVGYGRDDANVMSSFWDVEASDQTSSAGGTGRTTAEMQTATTFLEAGWDFVGETENGTDDIWWILEGQDYPRLWWQWPLVQVVDDFESYNDIPSEEMGSKLIYLTWIDGFDNPEINGCVIGELFTPFWPPDPHGGSQTMPFQYNNSGQAHYSEATARTENLEIDQDWTKDGLQTLSIWFYGDPSNTPDPMYVALANNGGSVGTVFYDDLDAILRETWTEWTIPLTESSNQGVILTNVYTISIGFGDKNNPKSGGSGKVYFDDIRLYRSSP